MSTSEATNISLRVVLSPDEPMTPHVARCLADAHQGAVSHHATLSEAASLPGQLRILVPLVHPVEALARYLDRMDSTAQAMTAWKSDAAMLLISARRIRRQLTLIDARAFLSRDPELFALLGPDFTDPDLEETAKDRDSGPQLPNAAMLVVADALLHQDPEASHLMTEIDALRHGPDMALLTDRQLENAHRIYLDLTSENLELQREQKRLKEDNPKIASLKKEKAALAEEVTLLLGNLEKQIAHQETIETQHAQLMSEFEKQDSELTELRKAKSDLTKSLDQMKALHSEKLIWLEKNNLLNEQNVKQTAAHEKLISAHTTLEVALKEANAKLKTMAKIQADLDARTAEVTKLKKEKMVLAEEAGLLRDNIGLSLSELEKNKTDRKNLIMERDALREASVDREVIKANAEALQRRVETITRKGALREAVIAMSLLQDQKDMDESRTLIEISQDQLAKLKVEKTALSSEIAFLQGELDKVYGSKSWRVTKPLRSVRALTGPRDKT